MTKGKAYYQLLMKHYLDGDCTPQEAKELLDHIQTHDADRLLLEEMKTLYTKMLQENQPGQQAAWSAKMRETLAQKIQPQAKVIPLYKIWLPRVAAAVVIFTVSIALYLNYNQSTKQATGPVAKNTTTPLPQKEILPGGDKALLTLADGTVIVLDEAKNGNVALQGGTAVNKKNGQLIYDASKIANATTGEITYNTITTPKGGQYQVVLPDGSKAWLNAASTLRFPTAFVGAARNVELKGEGYFEIEKNAAMPFHVKVNDLDVTVLGTHFNVMAYDNESSIKTTLIEGSVNISKGAVSKILKPGQQGKLDNATGKMNVEYADTDEAVAWKNGYFHFTNEDIQSIMRQFARWYDIEVAYEGNVRPRPFTGEVSRNVNLSQALKVLELSNIKFKMDGKKIVVFY